MFQLFVHFSMYLILSSRDKNSSLYFKMQMYLRYLSSRLVSFSVDAQVTSGKLVKNSVSHAFFSLTLNDFFPAPLFVRNTSSVIFSLCSSQRKGILVYFAINTKSKMKHVFSFETTLYFCQNAFENFNSYLRNFFGGHQLRNQIWPYLPSTKVKL